MPFERGTKPSQGLDREILLIVECFANVLFGITEHGSEFTLVEAWNGGQGAAKIEGRLGLCVISNFHSIESVGRGFCGKPPL